MVQTEALLGEGRGGPGVSACSVEVHVRLVFCGGARWVLRGVAVCRFGRGFVLVVGGPVLLGGLVVLGQLHLGLGLVHDGVTSREQLLGRERVHINVLKHAQTPPAVLPMAIPE